MLKYVRDYFLYQFIDHITEEIGRKYSNVFVLLILGMSVKK